MFIYLYLNWPITSRVYNRDFMVFQQLCRMKYLSNFLHLKRYLFFAVIFYYVTIIKSCLWAITSSSYHINFIWEQCSVFIYLKAMKCFHFRYNFYRKNWYHCIAVIQFCKSSCPLHNCNIFAPTVTLKQRKYFNQQKAEFKGNLYF